MIEKPWHRLKEEELLEKKISDLGLEIRGTALSPLIQKLYCELNEKGLVFHPQCFLADEWFCPVDIPAIGIPFYLAHPRLKKLEQKYMLEVEGGTKSWFMQLIRHETAHAFSYAYRLSKRKKWKQLFGSPSKDYPETYRPKPYSRSYVLHLDNWYAQSHPDEDFAETFAIWLTPKINWRKRYKGWIALKKLEYVDSLMTSLKNKPPLSNPKFVPKEYSGLGIKLKTYVKRKKKLFAEHYPDFYDNNLKQLFTDDPALKGSDKASRYLKESQQKIIHSVAFWTKEKKYTIFELIKNLISRCDELGLYVRKGDLAINYESSSFVTALIMNYLFTGEFKRSK